MEMIGSCGLICTKCPAYIATITDDNDLRITTAKHWSEIYSAEIKPKDIYCSGCRKEGVKFSHCQSCPVRLCAIDKEVENCAFCNDYSCQTLDKFLEYIPQAREKLKELRNN